MKGKALLIGLNYAHCADGKLNGCINDVNNVREFLQKKLDFSVKLVNDQENLFDTSYLGIMTHIYQLALDSHKEDLDYAWIHYSGHGSWKWDRNGDELDRRDECLVPCDYDKGGMLLDDDLNRILKYFNKRTKLICIFDCCHSGTILDAKYSWPSINRRIVENYKDKIKCNMICISGCLDKQYSADAWNVAGNKEYSGAMSSYLLMCLEEDESCIQDVFRLVSNLRDKLSSNGFKQYPKLTSTYNLSEDITLVKK